MSLYILNTIFNDAPQPWQIGFQDSAAPGFTGIVELHDTIFFYLVVICVGSAAAGASVGSAIFKSTQSVPPAQRLAFVAGGVATSIASSKVGLASGQNLTKNIDISKAIEGSKHANPKIDHIPSPDEPNFTINSPLEEYTEIPLIGIIQSILSLNVLELFLIIMIIIVLSNNKIKTLILNNIKILIVNYVPVKYVKIHRLFDKLSFSSNTRLLALDKLIVLIYLLILLGIKLMNIYFVSVLNINIDDFVLVYNHLKKSNLFMLIIPLLNYKIKIKDLNIIYFKDLNIIYFKEYIYTPNKNLLKQNFITPGRLDS